MAGSLMLGRYEQKERIALKLFLDPSLPVVECGASSGIISCLTNKRLNRPTEHVVVEASPTLIPLLTRNRELNECRFTIVHGAIAYGAPTIAFDEATEELVVGRVSQDAVNSRHAVAVQTVTLTDLLKRSGWSVCTLVCDIEGAETHLFRNELDAISRYVRWVLVETHRDANGVDSLLEIDAALHERGFNRVWSQGDMHVFSARERNA
jgi:FkbM family methyltransferase